MRALFASLLCCAAALSAAPLPRLSPDLTIHLTPSGQVSPAQYKGKAVVLAFIQTTCPHCQRTTGVLSALQREYGPRGLQVLASAFNPMANMLVPDFIKQFQPAFPVGWNQREEVLGYLDHPAILQMYVPVLVLIDRTGMIRHQYSGDDPFQQDQEKNLRAAIESLLKEPAKSGVAPAKKKAQ
jgi:peroxiredoxin